LSTVSLTSSAAAAASSAASELRAASTRWVSASSAAASAARAGREGSIEPERTQARGERQRTTLASENDAPRIGRGAAQLVEPRRVRRASGEHGQRDAAQSQRVADRSRLSVDAFHAR
jgi:hypothetical protein